MIGDDGEQLGVMPTFEAQRLAESKMLDLVEVSPKAVPPVCRIMDYGKFKYEQSKKTAQARKHATVIEIKEIKFRPKTDDHDFDFKVRHIRRFLEEGNKVRLVIAFRGREIVHPETGKAVLDRVVRVTSDMAHVEQMPLMEGRRMLMVVSPRAAFRPVSAPAPMTPRPAAALGQVGAPSGGGDLRPAAPPAPAAPAPAATPAAK